MLAHVPHHVPSCCWPSSRGIITGTIMLAGAWASQHYTPKSNTRKRIPGTNRTEIVFSFAVELGPAPLWLSSLLQGEKHPFPPLRLSPLCTCIRVRVRRGSRSFAS
eukprot:1135118-Rhodomonas_salina.1